MTYGHPVFQLELIRISYLLHVILCYGEQKDNINIRVKSIVWWYLLQEGSSVYRCLIRKYFRYTRCIYWVGIILIEQTISLDSCVSVNPAMYHIQTNPLKTRYSMFIFVVNTWCRLNSEKKQASKQSEKEGIAQSLTISHCTFCLYFYVSWFHVTWYITHFYAPYRLGYFICICCFRLYRQRKHLDMYIHSYMSLLFHTTKRLKSKEQLKPSKSGGEGGRGG